MDNSNELINTGIPSRAIRSAIALPMPRDPPVTIAYFIPFLYK